MFRLYLKMSLIRLKKVIKQMELGICIIHLCKTYVSCTVLQNEPWIGDRKTHVHVKNSELYFISCFSRWCKIVIFFTTRAKNKLTTSFHESCIFRNLQKNLNKILFVYSFKVFFLRVFLLRLEYVQKKGEYKNNI